MSTGPGRILTTHTGSLPRPDDLIRMMWAKADGCRRPCASVTAASAVREVVERQAACDIVNDGEMSKPSYATYVQDRLTGFGGESIQDYFFADLVDYPRSAELVAANPGRRKRSAPACTDDITVRPDDESVAVDVRNLAAALSGADVAGSFSSAAPPGVVSLFANQHYLTDEDYLFAIAEAMRAEYEAIAAASGLTVQVDCPDLAMGRHSARADGSRRLPPPDRASTSRRSTTRCATSRPSSCACICAGATIRARTITTSTSRIIDSSGRPSRAPCCSRQRTCATPTSGRCSNGSPTRRQDPVPGRGGTAVELHRAPSARGAEDLALRRPRRAPPGDGRGRLRLQRPRRHAGHRPTSRGSSPPSPRGRSWRPSGSGVGLTSRCLVLPAHADWPWTPARGTTGLPAPPPRGRPAGGGARS